MWTYIGKPRKEHYFDKNIGLFLHRDHKSVENHNKKTTKAVLPVSHLWGWQLEAQSHKLRHKEFLNHSHFIHKRVQELQAFEKKKHSLKSWCPSLTLHFLWILLKFQAGMSWFDTYISFFQAVKSQYPLSPHLRNPGLPDAIGAKYFSYCNHSNLQRMYTEVPYSKHSTAKQQESISFLTVLCQCSRQNITQKALTASFLSWLHGFPLFSFYLVLLLCSFSDSFSLKHPVLHANQVHVPEFTVSVIMGWKPLLFH